MSKLVEWIHAWWHDINAPLTTEEHAALTGAPLVPPPLPEVVVDKQPPKLVKPRPKKKAPAKKRITKKPPIKKKPTRKTSSSKIK